MTSAEKNRVILGKGKVCPFCGNENILGAYIDHTTPGTYTQKHYCFECNRRWLATFNLVDVEEIFL